MDIQVKFLMSIISNLHVENPNARFKRQMYVPWLLDGWTSNMMPARICSEFQISFNIPRVPSSISTLWREINLPIFCIEGIESPNYYLMWYVVMIITQVQWTFWIQGTFHYELIKWILYQVYLWSLTATISHVVIYTHSQKKNAKHATNAARSLLKYEISGKTFKLDSAEM